MYSRHQTGKHFEQQLTILRSSIANLFPVLEAQFYIDHPFYYEPPYPANEKDKNRRVETDEEMFYLLEKDLRDASKLIATINGEKIFPIRARSPIFKLKVSEKNVLRNRMQQGIVSAGEYRAVTEGYWLLVILSSGNHEIHFEAALGELYYSATYNILLQQISFNRFNILSTYNFIDVTIKW